MPNPDPLLPETNGLGFGEAAAITLAWQNRNASRSIVDEKRGRQVAEALGLRKTGVVGIISEAAARGWLDFDEGVERIAQTGFHLSDAVILLRSLSEWERHLPDGEFLRIDRSRIVRPWRLRTLDRRSRAVAWVTLDGLAEPLKIGRIAAVRLRRHLDARVED